MPGQKKPLTEHGFHDATVDALQLVAWFKRWPDANVAMPTGAPYYDVLDVDVRASGAGWPAYNQANRSGLTAGWTHAVRTPSGGLHLYYPGSEQRSATLPTRHLDFRGVGGYVVLPPSHVHTDTYAGDYKVVAGNSEPARPLDWAAIRALIAPPAPPSDRLVTARHATGTDVAAWLSRWITQQPEGNRNQALFWAACRAAERGVSDTRPLIEAATGIGLAEREATTTVASAYRRIGTQQRRIAGRPAQLVSDDRRAVAR